jgi:deaminated glutathione amidase
MTHAAHPLPVPPHAPATFRAGLVQLCVSRSVEKNLLEATRLIRDAVKRGAQYVQTPEVTTLMETDTAKLMIATRPEEGNPALAHFRSLARELKIWLHIGSMGISVGGDRLANRGYLISPAGAIVTSYDKIHMFDVQLANGDVYRESKNYRPGADAVVAELPWGRLGMTICYDLRFAALYRTLAQAGAAMLAIPAAFTVPTGQAHWHVLMRARAIETGCFVLAAAQGGRHEAGRSTYGHSLIVSPWGEIIAEANGDEPGVVIADIDLQHVADARSRIPALSHDRPFVLRDAAQHDIKTAVKVAS